MTVILKPSCDSERELHEALVEARNRAAAGNGGRSELHLYPGVKHESSPQCWCEPMIHYVDPDTGVRVFRHREVQ